MKSADWRALVEAASERGVSFQEGRLEVAGIHVYPRPIPEDAGQRVIERLTGLGALAPGAGPRIGARASFGTGRVARWLRGPGVSGWWIDRLGAVGYRRVSPREVAELAPDEDASRPLLIHDAAGVWASMPTERLSFAFAAPRWTSSHQLGAALVRFASLDPRALPRAPEDAEAILAAVGELAGPLQTPIFHTCKHCGGAFEGHRFITSLEACHPCAERHEGVLF